MTEEEWMACEDPRMLFEFLSDKASERKMRLFAAECFHHLADLLPDPRQQEVIQVLEQMAEGTITKEGSRKATRDARSAIPWPDDRRDDGIPADHLHFVGLMLYRELASSHTATHAVQAAYGRADSAAEQKEQCRLFRDIFGNPFRPVAFDVAWRTSDAMGLAKGIYDDRAFDRMPILADALQDAGCTSDEILNHLRDPHATHVRGCWALDLVLGKE